MTVGERIKHYRKEKGLSQMKLGLKCGFPDTTADVRIQQYESGLKNPRIKMINTIANALEIDPLFLQYDELIVIKNKVYGLLEVLPDSEYCIDQSHLSSCL